jgi:microcystin-dependent protein
MATVTPGYTWTSGETVTPAKLNSAAAPTVVVADGEVTVAKLAAAVQQLLVPAGAVQAFAMNSAPTGWLAADGNEYDKTGTYAALFAAIGTTYGETNGSGGAGTSHFRVPDLRGYFVRGSGTNSDSTASGTFGVKQAHAFESHRHFVMSNGSGVAISNGNQTMQMIGNQGDNPFSYQLFGTTSLTAQANTGPTSSTGGTETRPANIALLYCIKF